MVHMGLAYGGFSSMTGQHIRCEQGRDGHREDEADRSNENADDLGREYFVIDGIRDAVGGILYNEQKWQRGADVRDRERIDQRPDVLAADADRPLVDLRTRHMNARAKSSSTAIA